MRYYFFCSSNGLRHVGVICSSAVVGGNVDLNKKQKFKHFKSFVTIMFLFFMFVYWCESKIGSGRWKV